MLLSYNVYSTFDEVCVLAHKGEQQRKRNLQRREFPKPPVRTAPFHKGSSNLPQIRTAVQPPVPPPVLSLNPASIYPSFPQRIQAPQKAFTPSNRPNPSPKKLRRCFKCQGLGHIAADCPNRRVIMLAKWDAVKEEVVEEEKEEDIESPEEEEVIVEAYEGEMLVLRRALNS